MTDGPDEPTLDWLDDGGVTTPTGFSAGGIYTGVKTYGEEPRLDLGSCSPTGPARSPGY